MTRIKLNQEMFGLSALVEKIIKVRVKDCFLDETGETMFIIVDRGFLRKALGQNAENVKKIQQRLGKKVRLIEFRDNVTDFVKNVIYPLKVQEVTQKDNSIIIKDDQRKTKSLLIGRGGKNLKLLNRAVKRFFSVDDVKVE